MNRIASPNSTKSATFQTDLERLYSSGSGCLILGMRLIHKRVEGLQQPRRFLRSILR